MLNNDYFLFKKGIKPTYFGNRKNFKTKILLKTNFPNISLHNEKHLLFFQNNEEKLSFLNSLTNKEEFLNCDNVKKNHKLIGKALKFPPNSIESFINLPVEQRTIIDYHGICFSAKSDKQEILDSLKWIEKEIPIPKKYKTRIIIYKNNKHSMKPNFTFTKEINYKLLDKYFFNKFH